MFKYPSNGSSCVSLCYSRHTAGKIEPVVLQHDLCSWLSCLYLSEQTCPPKMPTADQCLQKAQNISNNDQQKYIKIHKDAKEMLLRRFKRHFFSSLDGSDTSGSPPPSTLASLVSTLGASEKASTAGWISGGCADRIHIYYTMI